MNVSRELSGPDGLEEHLLPLRRQARDWAEEIRSHALDWDRAQGRPEATPRLALHMALATLQVPERYGAAPLVVEGHRFRLRSALERVVFFEEGAWGDTALLMAAPGALTAGPVVEALGDRAQQDWFYERLLQRPSWSFLAMTEAGHGSDAGGMRSSLTANADSDGYVLSGDKKYIGNAARASIGAVFARTGPGPLDLRAVLVETDAPGVTSAPLPTIGLAGALGSLTLDGVGIGADRLLARHLPPTRRGMWGWLRSFNLLRAVTAAMGVGIARAAHEYVLLHRTAPNRAERDRLERMARDIEAVRQLTRQAAREVDADPDSGQLSAAAKVAAARLAERTTLEALGFFGCGARLEHPLLDKWARDARGIEYMEGTANIQRLNLYTSLVRGGLDAFGLPPGDSSAET